MTRCAACAKPLKFRVDFDADGVTLVLCGGCAGEAAAFSVYGDEAVTTVDWREVRRRAAERSEHVQPTTAGGRG